MTLSVIIPVYNVSAYIERCIRSVMNQTISDFECILVDDCGTDDSIVKCERMIAEYDGPIRFKMIHHEHNRGLSAARNSGTDAATGDYILYIDSDDEITSDCLEKLMAPILRDGSIEMVIGNAEQLLDRNPPTRLLSHHHDAEYYNGLDVVRNCFFRSKKLCVHVF